MAEKIELTADIIALAEKIVKGNGLLAPLWEKAKSGELAAVREFVKKCDLSSLPKDLSMGEMMKIAAFVKKVL